MKLLQIIRRNIVYWIALVFYQIFDLLPRRLAVFMGGWLGLLSWKIITRDQQSIFRHLTLCFNGALSPREKVNIGQRFFINSGRNIADLVRFKSVLNEGPPDFIEHEGIEHFDRAYIRGKGVFGITAHLGNFELLGAYFASLGYKIGVISRPLADNKLNDLIVSMRKNLGITNFYASETPVGVVRWLKSGGAVGVLIDTDSSRVKGEYMPIFGRLAKVSVGQSIIAIRAGTALVPMCCIRIEKNRYKVIIRPEIPINKISDSRKDIYRITELCTREIEELIRQYPDQWIWMHNRWKNSQEQISS